MYQDMTGYARIYQDMLGSVRIYQDELGYDRIYRTIIHFIGVWHDDSLCGKDQILNLSVAHSHLCSVDSRYNVRAL